MSMSRPFAFLTLCFTVWLTAQPCFSEQDPIYLVSDLAEIPNAAAGLDPTEMTVLGDQLIFIGWHPLTGKELWRSDGTVEGTRLVADTCPGTCGLRTRLARLGDAVFFESCSTVPVCQLWKSDGTPDGTMAITRLSRSHARVSHLTPWRDALYFVASDAAHGAELWQSDGTAEGTALLADLVDGPGDGGIRTLAVAADQLFMEAVHGSELWASDGTPDGTRRLQMLSSTSFFTSEIVDAGARAFWVNNHFRLQTSDGTSSGTRQVVRQEYPITLLGALPGKVFYTALAFDSVSEHLERQLWISDGTMAGTQVLLGGLASSPFPGFAVGGELYFGIDDQLWRSDGTRRGTVRVAKLGARISSIESLSQAIFVGTHGGLFRIKDAEVSLLSPLPARSLTVFEDGLAFQSETPEAGRELAVIADVVTAGAGATPLTDIVDPGSSFPAQLTGHDGSLLFASSLEPAEVYQTRGTAAEPQHLGAFDSPPLRILAGQRAFVAEESLWGLDEDDQLMELFSGPPGGVYDGRNLLRESATFFADHLFFLVWNFDTDHIELWSSDGTADGTRQLDELMEYTYCFLCDPPLPFPTYGIVATDTRAFAFFENRLWSSDGSTDGAVEIDLGEGCDGCIFGPATGVGARLFISRSRYGFAFNGSPAERSLWTSDGTQEGTFKVREFVSPSPGGFPARLEELIGLGETLFFTVDTADLGEELWRSDGTAAGTLPVADLRPGAESSTPRHLTVLDDRLYFSADDGVRGHELWTSDGSPQGTRLVADLRSGAASSFPQGLASIGGRLYFAADDGAHGLEPWISDGTAAGTRQIQDLEPGSLPSQPQHFTAVGPLVYSAAGTSETGFELWAYSRQLETCDACLQDGRFEVTVQWLDDGVAKAAQPVAFSDETMLFWFFTRTNTELLVKVLDGRGVNGHFWVFFGALSDLEYRVRVEDRLTGAVRTYHNPRGSLCGQNDVLAFPAAAPAQLPVVPLQNEPAWDASPSAASGACVPRRRTLCLQDGRFGVEVEWTNQHAGGVTGFGRARPDSHETGYFWFFDAANLELAVKILDGRSINGKFWFFYGALSDLEYRITVTDWATGALHTYYNPPGEICGRGDIEALEP